MSATFESINKKFKLEKNDVSRIPNKNIFWIQVNNIVYQINKQVLDSMEPDSILLNINSNEFNTEYNKSIETLIYNEKIENINLIIDYLQEYSINTITMIFNHHENNFNSNQLSELQRFIILAARFKMQNLIRNLQAKYPSLFIDNYEVILNRNTITKVEPNNILLDIFNEKTKINNNC